MLLILSLRKTERERLRTPRLPCILWCFCLLPAKRSTFFQFLRMPCPSFCQCTLALRSESSSLFPVQLSFQLFPSFIVYIFPFYWIIPISMHKVATKVGATFKEILSTLLHLSVTVLFISFSWLDTAAYIPSLEFLPSLSFGTPFPTGFALPTSPVSLSLRWPCPVLLVPETIFGPALTWPVAGTDTLRHAFPRYFLWFQGCHALPLFP